MNNTIKSITDGIVRREELHRIFHADLFYDIYNSLNYSFGLPLTISRVGDIITLNFAEQDRPDGFDRVYSLYSIRVNNLTGYNVRKGYLKGNISDITPEFYVVATGVYLDDNTRITLYHSIDGGYMPFSNTLTIETPYMGTTYLNGKVERTTEYSSDV